ncbi:MAG: hypothetical protein AAGD43_16225 [Pseudomonadota bacterium]
MTLSANHLEVWWTNAQAASAVLDEFASEIGLPAETDIERGSDASRWARIILRFGLARFGDQSLVCCPITRSTRGRPELVGSDRPVFSISHSADHIAVAIADAGPLGIDIEFHRPIKMSPARQEGILRQVSNHGLAMPTDDKSAAAGNNFLSVWTKLESIAKARGDGIGAVLTELKADPSGKANMFAEIDGALITVDHLPLLPQFAAALAKPRQSGEVEVRQLPSDLSGLRELYDKRSRSGA